MISGKKHALIAFGANLPFAEMAPEQVILQAIQVLADDGLPVVRQSRMFGTLCFPAGSGPDYVNAVAEISFPSDMLPEALLARLHGIEARFGRERVQRWGGRTLDIDLLAIGDSVWPHPQTYLYWRDLDAGAQQREAPAQLILPHPRLQDRAFVLVPLADICPDWRHPVLGLTVAQMLARLPADDLDGVVPLHRGAPA